MEPPFNSEYGDIEEKMTMIVVYVFLAIISFYIIGDTIWYCKLSNKRQKAYDRLFRYRNKKEDEKRESDKKIDELNGGFFW